MDGHSLENLQEQTDFLYRPIRSLGRLFNRYITVTFFGESTRSNGLLVSANQIILTVIEPLYSGHILWRIYKIGRTFGISQSDHFDGYSTVINGQSLGVIVKIGWSESYRPIKSLGRVFNRFIRSHSLENLQDRTDFWYRPIRSF